RRPGRGGRRARAAARRPPSVGAARPCAGLRDGLRRTGTRGSVADMTNSEQRESSHGDAAPGHRLEARRVIRAPAREVFAVLCDPDGHVAIDSSGMLQSAEGERVAAVGDRFVVHMDREALGDYDLGRYDVTVIITRFEPGVEIAW